MGGAAALRVRHQRDIVQLCLSSADFLFKFFGMLGADASVVGWQLTEEKTRRRLDQSMTLIPRPLSAIIHNKLVRQPSTLNPKPEPPNPEPCVEEGAPTAWPPCPAGG